MFTETIGKRTCIFVPDYVPIDHLAGRRVSVVQRHASGEGGRWRMEGPPNDATLGGPLRPRGPKQHEGSVRLTWIDKRARKIIAMEGCKHGNTKALVVLSHITKFSINHMVKSRALSDILRSFWRVRIWGYKRHIRDERHCPLNDEIIGPRVKRARRAVDWRRRLRHGRAFANGRIVSSYGAIGADSPLCRRMWVGASHTRPSGSRRK